MMSTDKQVVKTEPENEFTTTHHVYEPHRAGIPPLANYTRELWKRREFASEMSKATLRGANRTLRALTRTLRWATTKDTKDTKQKTVSSQVWANSPNLCVLSVLCVLCGESF